MSLVLGEDWTKDDLRAVAQGHGPGVRQDPCRVWGSSLSPSVPLPPMPAETIAGLIDGAGFYLLEFDGQIDDDSREDISQDYEGVVTIKQIARSSLPPGTRTPSYVLVRPDGYIATAGHDSGVERARRYLDRWVRPTTSREHVSSWSDA